jgi:hypothetical protein
VAVQLTGSEVVYDDLISSDDKSYWDYLCKNDIRRIEKLLSQSMGEGNF